MKIPTLARATFVFLSAMELAGCASRGVPSRAIPSEYIVGKSAIPDPGENSDPAHAWYIEQKTDKSGKKYSCSFLEFDDRGDYLDFQQHRHAHQKLKSLSNQDGPVLTIMFVHGWRNSSQSGNVTGFVAFLRKLAESPYIIKHGFRVHGIYLGWRGGVFKPSYPSANELSQTGFEQPIVDRHFSSPLPLLTEVAETFGYWIDKELPEQLMAGTAISRSIYTLATLAKQTGGKDHNKVFLVGHSFGALLLERTLLNATTGHLLDQWQWQEDEKHVSAMFNPLPFDTILLINSAAPSIYAKQFRDLLGAHRKAILHAQNGNHSSPSVLGSDTPIVISLTSEGDWATGFGHRLGNLFAGFSTTLQHSYKGFADDILARQEDVSDEPVVPQAEFYKRTPGHNPLLVNRWIESAKESTFNADPLEHNLTIDLSGMSSTTFYTTRTEGEGKSDSWEIRFPTSGEHGVSKERGDWSKWEGFRPSFWDAGPGNDPLQNKTESLYWIMRCPKEIISDHNDIWNVRAMETYAALFRISSRR